MALRRHGEAKARAGESPEPLWEQAQDLLDGVLAIDKDPETLGIAGGLAKQRGLRELAMGRRPLAAAHLDTAARLYLGGVEADPLNFYVGLNAVTTLRILAQRLGGPRERLDQARDLLPVVLWFARTAAEREPHDFWAVVTVAELVLTEHLLGDTASQDDVVLAYARAAAMPPKADQAISVRNQRQLYEAVGDPPELIDQVRALFEPRR
jgi:hypothetical protein